MCQFLFYVLHALYTYIELKLMCVLKILKKLQNY
jgi:hypothetical protein